MTKKLLFNGCSMTAGDAITWDKYHPDIDWWEHLYLSKPHSKYSRNQIIEKQFNYYTHLRILDNLAGQTNKLTGLPVEDLSEDGNSNQNICMSTIGFLEELSVQERKNYHVCIGWSENSRRLGWNPNNKSFINLNISEIDSIHKIYFHQYIKESMINRDDIDHIMNYFHNIVSLQNYLKANDITYTFWNTLNDIKPAVLKNIKNYKNFKIKPYQHEVIFNQEDWLLFGDSEHPWLGPPWSWSLLSLDKQISEKNRHPNLEAVIELAKKVVAHISTTTET
jgi:hypothetical protein